MPDVAHHSDNRKPFARRDGNLLTHRVAIRPVVVGQVLVDDHNRLRCVRVLLVEIAAGQDA